MKCFPVAICVLLMVFALRGIGAGEPKTFQELMDDWDRYSDQTQTPFVFRIAKNPRALCIQEALPASVVVREAGAADSPFFCYYLRDENGALYVEAVTVGAGKLAKAWMLNQLGADTWDIVHQAVAEGRMSAWRGARPWPGVSRFFLSSKFGDSRIGNFSFDKRFGGFEGHRVCEVNFIRGNTLVSVFVPISPHKPSFSPLQNQEYPKALDPCEIAWKIDQYLNTVPLDGVGEEEKIKLKTLEITLPDASQVVVGKELTLDFPRTLPDGTVPAEIRLVVSRGEIQQISENPSLASTFDSQYTVLFGQPGRQTVRCYHLDETGQILAWGETAVEVKQEPPKLTLLGQDWREKNPQFLEKMTITRSEERMRALRTVVGPDFDQMDADEQTLKAIMKILWPDRTKNANSSVYIEKMVMEENAIAGYFSPYTPMAGSVGRDEMAVTFQVDTNQFQEVIDTHSASVIPIICSIYFCKNAEEGLVQMFRKKLVSSMHYSAHFAYHQLQEGPGDACLISGDRKIILIRGNVVVGLTSYYKDFGCMDLACRLDAFLVEQFEKAQKDEVKAGK